MKFLLILSLLLLSGCGPSKPVVNIPDADMSIPEESHSNAEKIKKSTGVRINTEDFNFVDGMIKKGSRLSTMLRQMEWEKKAEKYYQGDGVEQSYLEAEKWYIKSAETGGEIAANRLSTMYITGLVVPKDKSQAMKWHHMAAESNYYGSLIFLAESYFKGKGLEKDWKKAAKWYLRAAKLGDVKSQYQLGMIALGDEGKDKNEGEALKWFAIAATSGNEKAREQVKNLTEKLTKNQITNAYKKRDAWLQSYAG